MTPKIRAAAGLAMLVGLGLPFAHGAGAANGGKARLPAKAADCGAADAGITLPPGFCATVFADGLGHARHMAVAPDGTLYVNTWSGRYYRNAPPPPEAGFMVALRDTDGDGRADRIERFGPSPAKGGTGGTGIALFGSGLYAEAGADVVRYALAPGRIAPAGPPEVVVSGLPLEGDHPMHPFVIDRTGALFLNSGSATNACQPANRKPGISGADPCTELETRGPVAIRREGARPALLARRPLRHGHPQHRRSGVRWRRAAVGRPARARPALAELARPLLDAGGCRAARRGVGRGEGRRRLWLAALLLRSGAARAHARARIWR